MYKPKFSEIDSSNKLTKTGAAMCVNDVLRNIASGNLEAIENMFYDEEDADDDTHIVRNMDIFERMEYVEEQQKKMAAVRKEVEAEIKKRKEDKEYKFGPISQED